MSKQIQSLLNEMENKFEESFSDSNHEEPLNKQLNPESGKKGPINNQIQKISNHARGNFDQISTQILKEMNKKTSNQYQENQIKLEKGQIYNQDSLEQLPKKRSKSKKLKMPNQKQKEEDSDKYLQEMRKTSSQIRFNKSISYQTEENEENPFYYKELSIKLEKALMKISSDKIVGSSKKSYGFYDRVQQFEQKKQRQIQRRKHQFFEKSISQIQDRPLINSYSRALVSQISNDPIYIRAEKIIEKRKEKEEQYKKIRQKSQQKEYQAFKEEFEGYMDVLKQKYEGQALRSPEEYYHEQLTWIKTKENKIQSRITQQKQKTNQQVTFKPLINSKSLRIINSKKDQKRVPIFDREPKIKEEIKDPNCTFKPKINKNNFYKKPTYYQAPF